MITYFIDLAIALTAFGAKPKQFVQAMKDTFVDFIAGVKSYPKTFVVLLIMAIYQPMIQLYNTLGNA